jgi:hypothetical protein
MASETLYTGPGKIYANSKGIFPEGTSRINFLIEQESDPVESGFHGRVSETGANIKSKLQFTPFDNWGLLATLFPAAVTTPAKGTRIHGAQASPVSWKVWTPDGRLYNSLRTAMTKHPDLNLGVGTALYGAAEATGLLLYNKDPGDAGCLYTITESAAADPGGNMAMTDFIREPWTGAWGAVTGFTAIEAEDKWTISTNVRHGEAKIGKLTRAMTLESVEIMAKVRPVGPTQTNIDTATGIQSGRTLGSRFATTAGHDLTLTSASGKTITIKNADVKGAGYEFGNGDKLGTGEIGFVVGMTFTAGAVDPLIVFSA